MGSSAEWETEAKVDKRKKTRRQGKGGKIRRECGQEVGSESRQLGNSYIEAVMGETN